jgi:hypothetical protein
MITGAKAKEIVATLKEKLMENCEGEVVLSCRDADALFELLEYYEWLVANGSA